MRIYDYLDEIRRALNAEESSGVPTPSWRIEEYLKDIYDAIRSGIYPSDEQVAEAINAWLDDHPEATTTVEDGAITNAKLASSFVTPGTAAAYSSSATYAVGDYVFYDGALYRCTTPITTAETWTAAHWTAAVLGDDIGDLKSAVNYVTSVTDLEFEHGGIYNGVETEDIHRIRSVDYLPCRAGTKISIKGNNAYQIVIPTYGVDKEFLANGTWGKEYTCQHDGYFRIIIRADTSDREITSEMFAPLISAVVVNYDLVPIIIDTNEKIVDNTADIESLNTNFNLSQKLLMGGILLQTTETGYAIKNNVAEGSVVDIDTPVSAAGTASIVIGNISAGMRFKVFGTGTYNYLLWAWLSADKKLLEKAGAWESSGADGAIITAPENASYLVCSSSIPYAYGFTARYLGATAYLDKQISDIQKAVDVTLVDNNLAKNASFRFAFFSDIHGSDVNAQHIVNYAEANNLDCIINGGDTVDRWINDNDNSFTWYATLLGSSSVDILSAVGNHDAWDGAYWEKASDTDIYNAIIAPIITNFSSIQQPSDAAENGLCYYYKDYNSVRVIVLNAMAGDESVDFWTEDQGTWLTNVLADAKENSKHVMICNHSPFPKNIALRDAKSDWNSWIDYRTWANSDDIVMKTDAMTIIKNFIDAGGKLIAIFSGHEHVDSILTATGFDGEFMINIASAKFANHPDGITYSNTASNYYDCFNSCAVDTTNGILKLVRIGWNMDGALKERGTLSYDYINHRLLHD